VELKDLWTAAAVLMGFQLAAFVWRLNRETDVSKQGGANWMPPADYLSLLSMFTTVFGVFVLPIAGVLPPLASQRLFGLSLILFAGYQLALLGHYKLLFRGAVQFPGKYVTGDELLIVLITLAGGALYLAVAFGFVALQRQ
jgi:hypothetical protein